MITFSTKTKEFIKDVKVKTAVTLTAGFIVYMVTLAYDWYNRTEILSSFDDWKNFIVASFISLANYQIKLWWLFLISLIVFVIWCIYKLIQVNKGTNTAELNSPSIYMHPDDIITDEAYELIQLQIGKTQEKERRMLSYKADKFHRNVWKWDWIYNDLIDQYEIKNLEICCPNLECKNSAMSIGWEQKAVIGYSCSKCQKYVRVTTFGEAIEDMILEKVNKF